MRIFTVLAIVFATATPGLAMLDTGDREEAKASKENVAQGRLVQPLPTATVSRVPIALDRNR